MKHTNLLLVTLHMSLYNTSTVMLWLAQEVLPLFATLITCAHCAHRCAFNAANLTLPLSLSFIVPKTKIDGDSGVATAFTQVCFLLGDGLLSSVLSIISAKFANQSCGGSMMGARTPCAGKDSATAPAFMLLRFSSASLMMFSLIWYQAVTNLEALVYPVMTASL